MRYRLFLVQAPGGMVARLRRLGSAAPQPGLPLYVARWAEELVRQRGTGAHRRGWWGQWQLRRLLRTLERGLAQLGYPGARAYLDEAADTGELGFHGRHGPLLAPEHPQASHTLAGRLEPLLAGRIWLEEELRRLARRLNLPEEAAIEAAEAMAQAGRLLRRAAVELDAAGAICLRCGSREGVVPDHCGRCGSSSCPRCTRCATMGLARGCSALYAMPLMPAARATGHVEATRSGLAVQLGPAQQQAWERLRQLVASHLESAVAGHPAAAPAGCLNGVLADAADPAANGAVPATAGKPAGPRAPGGCLVWAVTGAGKTEVAFGAVQLALERGQAVLFAAPRRDVAVDVALRARALFGEQRVQLVVGGRREGCGAGSDPTEGRTDAPGAYGTGAPIAPWHGGVAGQLVVATTHQALRFYRAFALAVVDEADAFPLRGSRMLEYAVARAVRPEGFVVVMTATPGPHWLGRARAGRWPIVFIPVRHHGQPLPVPELWVHPAMAAWEQAPHRPERVPPAVRRWLQQRRPGGRVLIFAPTVRLVEAAAAALGVPACHSRHPRREALKQAFAGGQIPVLVASPVLERGLTFEEVDVLVLFAHQESIFDEAALVQMAGRCGRTARSPQGRVLFAAARLTGSMRAALRHIRAMNRLAAAQGFLATGQGFLHKPQGGRGLEVV